MPEQLSVERKNKSFSKTPFLQNWCNASVSSAKYSIWPKQVMEKHKGNLPNWPGQNVYFSIGFCESSECSDRSALGWMAGQGPSSRNTAEDE